MKNLFYVIPVVGLLFFASCDKSESIEEPAVETNSISDKAYDFYKDIVISSDQGSQAVMRVYANSENILKNYTRINFKLVEIAGNETLKESLIRQKIMDVNTDAINKNEEKEHISDSEGTIESSIGFQLIEITAKKTNTTYAVSFMHPQNSAKASWSYFTHYSGIGQTIATVGRHSALRRVYYGLKYKKYSSSSWAIQRSEWKLLSNGGTYSVTRNPNYQYRMRIKTKGGSSAYTVEFSN